MTLGPVGYGIRLYGSVHFSNTIYTAISITTHIPIPNPITESGNLLSCPPPHPSSVQAPRPPAAPAPQRTAAERQRTEHGRGRMRHGPCWRGDGQS